MLYVWPCCISEETNTVFTLYFLQTEPALDKHCCVYRVVIGTTTFMSVLIHALTMAILEHVKQPANHRIFIAHP